MNKSTFPGRSYGPLPLCYPRKLCQALKQVPVIVEKENKIVGHGYYALSGSILVAFGALITLLDFIRYKRVQKQIEKGAFDWSTLA